MPKVTVQFGNSTTHLFDNFYGILWFQTHLLGQFQQVFPARFLSFTSNG